MWDEFILDCGKDVHDTDSDFDCDANAEANTRLYKCKRNNGEPHTARLTQTSLI